jgi:hypothetical protein
MAGQDKGEKKGIKTKPENRFREGAAKSGRAAPPPARKAAQKKAPPAKGKPGGKR